MAYSFDDNLKNDWIEIGGWYEDPTSASGWSTTNTTEAVSAYAHLKAPMKIWQNLLLFT